MQMNNEVVMVRLSDIIPNRFQPRLTFDEEALNELANSIKEHGIIQPLILRDLGSKYEIIAGERRYKASALAGLTEVPAIIGSMDDQTSAELALIENIQRKDLSAIEEAKSYKKILDMGNLTQETLAKRMGKSQSTIANKMRLLSLTNEVQVALMNNLISERHARCLLQVKDEEKQKEILNKIITERMNVRDTDEYIKSTLGLPKVENPDSETRQINVSPTNLSAGEAPSATNLGNVTVSIPEINPHPTSSQEVKETSPRDTFENPNVYTQSENIDFINISNLNSEEPLLNTSSNTLPNEIALNTPNSNTNAESNNLEGSGEQIQLECVQAGERQEDYLTKIKLATAIRLAKDTVDDIKTAGYNITMEEIDNQNEYQIILKIQK